VKAKSKKKAHPVKVFEALMSERKRRSGAAQRAAVPARSAPVVKVPVHAVEFFESCSLLNSKVGPHGGDEARDRANKEGEARRGVARRFRDLVERSWVSPLRSPDFGAVPSSGFGPRAVSDHCLDAVATMARIRQALPEQALKLLCAVFVDDVFLWVRRPKVLEQIRAALDLLDATGELDRQAHISAGQEARARYVQAHQVSALSF
jgi:hypothetical protein